MPRSTDQAGNGDEAPSRSARRRDALDMLAFAKQLSGLPAARLDKLGLPDAIRAELAEVQRTPSHIAHRRQLAHLAGMLRAHNAADLATARAVLAEDRATTVRDAAELHRIEALREALVVETDMTALNALVARHPGLDRQRLRSLIRQSRVEREQDRPPRAQRELFRLLRDQS